MRQRRRDRLHADRLSDATRHRRAALGRGRLRHRPAAAGHRRGCAPTPGVKVIEGPENRTIFLGMDQWRDELLYCDVKGKNPFKDLRVRQALYQAIDIEAIQTHARCAACRCPTGDAVRPSRSTATSKAEDKRLPVRRRPRQDAARRRGLSERLRASRSTARTTATSTTSRSARTSPRCGRAWASRPR